MIVFVPKADDKELRSIAFMSSQSSRKDDLLQNSMDGRDTFHSPRNQNFKNSCSCIDNLVILTSRIQFAYMRKTSTVAAFLDIAGAFDNDSWHSIPGSLETRIPYLYM